MAFYIKNKCRMLPKGQRYAPSIVVTKVVPILYQSWPKVIPKLSLSFFFTGVPKFFYSRVKALPMLSPCFLKEVPKLSQNCVKVVPKFCRSCLILVAKFCQSCLIVVTKLHISCADVVSILCKCFVKVVSLMCQSCPEIVP